ncbi:MAG: penicillin-binding protein 1C [Flavobacteriales bacterium]
MTVALSAWLSGSRKWLVGSVPALLLLLAWARWWPMDPLFRAPCSTVLLDRNGGLLSATVAEDGQWRFPPPDSLPPRFVTCLLQFEDRHFFEHRGVHVPSLLRAAGQNAKADHVVSGGSTLTMQVARLSLKGPERSYAQKCKEVLLALRLEMRHPKMEILKLFAANAPFGGNVVGLDAAAWRWFGQPAHDLGWAQCATLAVLPNAPSSIYPGKGHAALKEKRDRLLDRLLVIGLLDSLDWRLAKAEPLPGKAQPLPLLAPHLMGTLANTSLSGHSIRTTIDAELQQRATEAVAQYASALEANELHNAAMLIMEVPTGKVRAYVGNNPVAGSAHAGAVDIIRKPRSTGSLLKPFLYADMLQCGELLPDMIVADIPTHFSGFTPRNTDGNFSGAVPASRALARSLNVPAVRALRKHGVARTLRTLNAMGLGSLNRGADHYGLSLVLGGGECSLWEMAGAYASMARIVNAFGRTVIQGAADLVHPPVVLEQHLGPPPRNVEDQVPALSASAIYFTLEALRSVNRPENQSGWKTFSGGQPIAWKTGTSYGHRDAWAIGVTDRWCVAVWTGNASGEGRPGNTGTLAAAPLLFSMFGLLPASGSSEPPYDEMVRTLVCSRSGHRAGMYCEPVDSAWIPAVGMRTPPCPYHQRITVDATGHFRTTGSTGVGISWFVLPPAMEHYTAPIDPLYLPLPPWADGSAGNSGETPFELIYPEPGTRLLIPLELDGSPGNAVFEAAHRQLAATLYWHLDDQYLGSTVGDHRMAMSPAEGEHRITLTDASGATVRTQFSVVAGKRDRQP